MIQLSLSKIDCTSWVLYAVASSEMLLDIPFPGVKVMKRLPWSPAQ